MNNLSKVLLKCATLAIRSNHPFSPIHVKKNRSSTTLSLKIIHPHWATTNSYKPLNETRVDQVALTETDSKIKETQFTKELFASAELTPPPKGIPNLGNTCFIASIIQASLVFQKSELEERLVIANDHEKAIIRELLNFLKSYEKAKNNVDLAPLLQVLRQNRIYNGNQEDAAELLTWLANFLPNPSVYLKQIFKTAPLKEGESILEEEENKSQLVREIPLEIERNGSMEMRPGQTILGLLKNFFSETPVQDATIHRFLLGSDGNIDERNIPLLSRREILSEAPKVLTLQIKKFHQIHETNQIHRIGGQLSNVPETFLMPKEYCANGEVATYQLRSVICHRGNSIESGHYVAYVRREDNFFCANDGCISKIDREAMLEAAKNGYIFIYDKISLPS